MEKIELINLTLDEIRKACTTVNNVCIDTKRTLCKSDDCECLTKLVNNCDEVLRVLESSFAKCLKKLQTIRMQPIWFVR